MELFMDKTLSTPKISACQFMLLLCSGLVKSGKTILKRDSLIPKLYKFENIDKTKFLFEDVAFKKNIDTITSRDIEDSLCTLQTFGAIGQLNPAYEKIIIYINPDEADLFLSNFGKDINNAIRLICREL